jgi:hypothetical protein
MPGHRFRYLLFNTMNSIGFLTRRRIPRVEIKLSKIVGVLLCAAFAVCFIQSRLRSTDTSNTMDSSWLMPVDPVPIVIRCPVSGSVQGKCEVMSSDKAAPYLMANPGFPFRGFILARLPNVGDASGGLRIIARKDMFGPLMPALFGERDIWKKHTADGTLRFSMFADGLPNYDPPLAGRLVKNRPLALRLPIVVKRTIAGHELEISVAEIVFSPIDDPTDNRLHAKSETGALLFESDDSRLTADHDDDIIGNGMYRLVHEVRRGLRQMRSGLLVGVVSNVERPLFGSLITNRVIIHVVSVLEPYEGNRKDGKDMDEKGNKDEEKDGDGIETDPRKSVFMPFDPAATLSQK